MSHQKHEDADRSVDESNQRYRAHQQRQGSNTFNNNKSSSFSGSTDSLARNDSRNDHQRHNNAYELDSQYKHERESDYHKSSNHDTTNQNNNTSQNQSKVYGSSGHDYSHPHREDARPSQRHRDTYIPSESHSTPRHSSSNNMYPSSSRDVNQSSSSNHYPNGNDLYPQTNHSTYNTPLSSLQHSSKLSVSYNSSLSGANRINPVNRSKNVFAPTPKQYPQQYSSSYPKPGIGRNPRPSKYVFPKETTKVVVEPHLISVLEKMEDYDLMDQVGEGTFGYVYFFFYLIFRKVYKARRKGDTAFVALKRVRIETDKEGVFIYSIYF